MKTFLATVVALVSAAFAVETLWHLRGYRDSPTWIYLVFGGFWIALSVAFAVIAGRTARRRTR